MSPAGRQLLAVQTTLSSVDFTYLNLSSRLANLVPEVVSKLFLTKSPQHSNKEFLLVIQCVLSHAFTLAHSLSVEANRQPNVLHPPHPNSEDHRGEGELEEAGLLQWERTWMSWFGDACQGRGKKLQVTGCLWLLFLEKQNSLLKLFFYTPQAALPLSATEGSCEQITLQGQGCFSEQRRQN